MLPDLQEYYLITGTDLPSNWQPVHELKDHIPETHDWRTFAPIPSAPRYAASICGEGVYDLLRRCFLSPNIDCRNGRKRYRLVTSDPATGKLDAVKMPYYSTIILTLAVGSRPSRKMQAHHTDHDRTNDHFQNLSWVTGKRNRQLAIQHKSRAGSANPNAKMTGDALAEFILCYDLEVQRFGRADLKPYAEQYGMTTDQLRRLAKERSQAADVQAIRQAARRRAEKIAKQEAKGPKKRRIQPQGAGTNPFLDW